METQGLIDWQDNLCITGASHSKRLSDGTLINICYDVGMHTKGKPQLVLYKIVGDTINKRHEIARIDSDKTSLLHSFAMSEDYAVIFESHYHYDFNPLKMFTQNIHIENILKHKYGSTTKIQVIRLSDGEVTTIDSGKTTSVFHFGNAWQEGDVIHVEAPCYDEVEADPFFIFYRQNLQSSKVIT